MAWAPSLIPLLPCPFHELSDLARPRSIVGGSSFPPTCWKFSVREMGGFSAVLPPRVAFPAVAEPLPRNHLLLKGGAPKTTNHPPFPKPA